MMRRLVMAVVMASTLLLGTGLARAAAPIEDEYDDSMMHPLRIAAYLIHPIGFAAEWLIGRPFHYLISRPYLDQVFGYEPGVEDRMYTRTRGRL